MISAEEAVLNAMKNEGRPVRPGDVVKITGLDKNDVSKAIKELEKKGTDQFTQTLLLCSGEVAIGPLKIWDAS
jgi:hypothetical protein